MAEILTIAEARKAIRLPDNDTTKDADLTATYIPAVTTVVEDLIGPVMQRERTLTVDGNNSAHVVLPYLNVTVTSVVENGVTLVDGTGYSFNSPAGILIRGTALSPLRFLRGSNNVVVTYTAGAYATASAVPPNIKLAARIILAHLWQADQQGFRPDFGRPDLGGSADGSTVTTPSGYSVPRRAAELLGNAYTPLGFA